MCFSASIPVPGFALWQSVPESYDLRSHLDFPLLSFSSLHASSWLLRRCTTCMARILLHHAMSEFLEPSEGVLPTCVPLRSSVLTPLPRRRKILEWYLFRSHTSPDTVLRVRVLRFGQRSPLTQGSCVVSTCVGIHVRLTIRPCGGHGETHERTHKDDCGSERDGPFVMQGHAPSVFAPVV